MSKVQGIKLVLREDSKGRLSAVQGAKMYLVAEGDEVSTEELKGVVSFGIPERGVDDLLYITVTMPLLEVVYE